MTPTEFATAIGQIESGNNPNAPLGDDGCAGGRYQIHYDWLWTWAFNHGIVPRVGETRDSVETRTVQQFFTLHQTTMTPLGIAMYFHEGSIVHPGDPDWDQGYADKFNAAVG